ncbi:MAG: hypothetical protein HRU07_06785 [Nitrosopumilus sp.]|nr:hypothetical protein [Nitrosopumilus sp.]NRA05844.1 hypothetical protein [Nitrosopumilus sp.]
MKLFVIQTVCLRCGFINQITLGLINSNDNAVYKCNNCNFIVLTSWMEEQENCNQIQKDVVH